MRRLWLACVSVLGLSLMLACGSDDDDGASGSGGSGGGTGGTSGIGGASGTSGTGGTGAAGGAGGSGGTAATGGTGGTAGEAGSGANAGAAGSAGDAGSGGGNTVPLTVTIYDLVQQDPIADMKVCLHEAQPENCTTTNATGVATLHVPPNQDVVVTYGTAPNFRTHALAIGADAITNGTNITTGALLESIASYLFASVNVTDDPTKGHVVGLALATEGATASIDPFSGEGPIYTSPSGTPDPTLTATSDSGAFLFVNVDPGTVEVAVELAGGTCTHELGHTGSAPNATPVPVHAGWFSIAASFECL